MGFVLFSPQYFHGGMSTQQKTLPYGTVEDVVKETNHLLEMGIDGGYISCPSHATEGDTPIENIVAYIDIIKNQPGRKAKIQ